MKVMVDTNVLVIRCASFIQTKPPTNYNIRLTENIFQIRFTPFPKAASPSAPAPD